MNRADPIVIRKVANRRLYVPGAGCFVTLNYIAAMVRNGDDVVVYNDKTDENITHAILTKIIVE
jgi:polyhydroxyalkanoate synthesis regulator protein